MKKLIILVAVVMGLFVGMGVIGEASADPVMFRDTVPNFEVIDNILVTNEQLRVSRYELGRYVSVENWLDGIGTAVNTMVWFAWAF